MFVVLREQSLHEPMYYFLSMLSATDLSLSLCTLSTTLGVFWFEAREINLNACVAQIFFLHGFTFMESGVLLAMAFDRFVPKFPRHPGSPRREHRESRHRFIRAPSPLLIKTGESIPLRGSEGVPGQKVSVF